MSDPNRSVISPTPSYLLIGEILRPHGVAGELKMRVFTHHPEHLSKLKRVFLSDSTDANNAIEYQLKSVRMNQDYALLRLIGINDRNEADLLRQLYVSVAIEDAVPLEEGEHYLFELIGMDIFTEAGVALGVLVEVLETGANDVYIVDGSEFGEVLIPVTEQTILSTDTASNRIIVRLPEGLLPSP